MSLVLLPNLDVDDWREAGACIGYNPDLWFPEPPGPSDRQSAAAQDLYGFPRRVCDTACPVRNQCLTHALDHPETAGMWGGHTPLELRAIRKARRR